MFAPSGADSEMPTFLRRTLAPPPVPAEHAPIEPDRSVEDSQEYALAEEIVEDEELIARERAQQALVKAIHQILDAEKARRTQPLSRRFVVLLLVASALTFLAGQALPPEWFAGICGIVQLVWLFIASSYKIHSRKIEAAWTAVVVLYLVATIEAIVRLKWL
ncbi:MAG TPA: hypothetical protein VG713_17430 [Pirellulales bacterium]|nr:hypothetical protein [Pirellulales bacterium]